MTQYIDKSALEVEIKRRIKGLKDCHADTIAGYAGEISGLERLLFFIDSIPEEPVGEDLEKFATELANEYFPDGSNIWARPNFEARFLYDACIRTAQWQKEQLIKQLAHMPLDKAMDYIVKEAEK